MRKSNYLIILFILVTGICITLNYWASSKKQAVVNTVHHHYKNTEGLIRTYGRENDVHYLSESIGLYMEYLLLTQNKEEFEEQFTLLQRDFLIHQNKETFVKWELSEKTSTNALIDDLRLMNVLTEAGHVFKEKRYKVAANKVQSTLLHTHLKNKQLIDFYDWSSNTQANTLHLSYINYSALKHMNNLSASSYEEILEKGEDPASPFFLEVFNIDKQAYEKADSKQINMIDQLLIACQYEEITGEPPAKFDAWLRQEWANKGKIYGNYNRTELSPSEAYESSAVYALATLYFLQQKDDTAARELHGKLLEQPPFSAEANYADIHFFDYMYSMIADYSYTNRK
ncbi:glycoside transferase [Priestia megaterium]|nr:glycoside transferase [Priestia megaterium]